MKINVKKIIQITVFLRAKFDFEKVDQELNECLML